MARHLFIAVQQKNEELAIGLIEHGADVNATSLDGNTALHWAAIHRCERLVKFLIQHGADVNARGDEGRTALHYAALCSTINSVQSLVEGGADVKSTDNEGKTPLHVTLDWNAKIDLEYRLRRGEPSDENSTEIAVFLIGKGADLYAWPTPADADIECRIKEVETALVMRRIRALDDMYVFHDTLEPTNFFQWFPREILEDVLLLDLKVKELQDRGLLRFKR